MKKYIRIPILCLLLSAGYPSFSQVTFNWFARMVGDATMWDGQNIGIWGFKEGFGGSASLPGPIMIVNEGDIVTLNITNQSPMPHTVHLHGLDVNQANDGFPETSFEIPGMMGTGSYTFTAPHPGAYVYHCHVETVVHLQLGMYGAIIVRPADGSNTTWDGGLPFDQEYFWLTSEIDKSWHDSPPQNGDIPAYEPDYFLINGKSNQQLDAADVAVAADAGQNIFLRLANIGYGINEFVFPPELNATALSSDGRPLPQAEPGNTLRIYPGERYGVMLNSDSAFTGNILVHYYDMYDDDLMHTNEVPVQIMGTTGTSSAVLSSFSFEVFPNPVSETLKLEFHKSESEAVYLSLFDTSGKPLWHHRGNEKELSIPVSGFVPGVYFLQVETARGVFSRKVVVD